jgi:hypothetical protein
LLSDLQDYIVPNYTITFSAWSVPGGTRWCFPIYILDDNILEDSETITFQLVSSNPFVVVDTNHSIAIVNITEDTDDCKMNPFEIFPFLLELKP